MRDEPTPLDMASAEALQMPIAIADQTEIMFRQVHPNLFDGNQPASSAFLPSPGDQDQLSIDRSSKTTANDAFNLYVKNGRASIGTYGVTVGEFGEHGLRCFPDPIAPTETTKANPAHARVDFSSLGANQKKKVAKRLKRAAVSRGILYRP